MKIVKRDIDLMGWLLEQKVMTEKQIRNIFWKDAVKDNREVYRRLNKLKRAGYLKTNKNRCRCALYLLTTKGIRELNYPAGLGEISDTSYASLGHDLAITDFRIMLYKAGYTHWMSKRLLSKEDNLCRIPDGMICHRDKKIAFEYGPCRNSKRQYRKIFINYDVGCSHQIDATIYITNTLEFAHKLAKDAWIYDSLYFVSLEEIQRNQMNARLRRVAGECLLYELLETPRHSGSDAPTPPERPCGHQ